MVKNALGSDGQDVGIFKKLMAGILTGTIGSAIFNPFDLVKIRVQAEAGFLKDGILQSGLRKGYAPTYTSSLNAFNVIFAAGGLRGLYAGTGPTIIRAAMGTGAQVIPTLHSSCTAIQV